MKKHRVAKVLLRFLQIYLYENNFNCDPYRSRYKFAFILFLLFVEFKDKIQIFSRLVVWQREIILRLAILVRIIVSWLKLYKFVFCAKSIFCVAKSLNLAYIAYSAFLDKS